MFIQQPSAASAAILNLGDLDARNQHLLSLDSRKLSVFPCGLAAELWNIIIDHLHDDSPSLIACLAAHPAWGSFCRYHIYENFTWNAHDCSRNTVHDFHPCPRYVRRLIIDGPFADDHHHLSEPAEPEWLLPLADRLDMFNAVTHLEVESVDFVDIFDTHAWQTFRSSRSFLSRIESLNLSNIPLQPFQLILETISLFPSLTKLDYLPSHVDLDYEEDIDYDLYQPSTNWTAFSTEHAPLLLPTFGFWNWLSARTLTHLNTIRLDAIRTSDLPSLTSYLGLIGSSLKEFRVRFSKSEEICDFTNSRPLAKSTGLRHIELVGLCRQYSNSRIWTGKESLALLSTLPNGSLSSIDLTLDVSRRRIANSRISQTPVLDSMLSNVQQFPALRAIRVNSVSSVKNGEAEEQMKKGFEKCLSRGLLKVSVSSMSDCVKDLITDPLGNDVVDDK
ncbi:hypothetical protein D9757_013983 [Collybiopsis confluens]|uniref:Uncharacterized protein n=1 Tax=Collybiopsis confluens TaxID=2823264 RepID=A0A8H5CNB2_9AGAR|nr:hypothetical protein D9757_013983 [Collybiopsis confluens]